MSTSHAIGRTTEVRQAPLPRTSPVRPRTPRPPADHAGDVLMRTWRVTPSHRAEVATNVITWVLIALALVCLLANQWIGLAVLGCLTLAYVGYVQYVGSAKAKQRRAKRRAHLMI